MGQLGLRGGISEDVPDEGGLRLALRVTQVEDQGQVAVVDGDAGDIDDARDALLVLYQYRSCDFAGAQDVPWTLLTAGT